MQPSIRFRLACGLVVGISIMSIDEVFAAENDHPPRRVGAGYDRPAAQPHQSRSAVVAQNGIVATSHPLAAEVGRDILKAGGNAVDAAIATSAMMGLVEPMSCGIGGDAFVIYWDAKTEKLYGLNGSGRSPYALNREVFQKLGLAEIPDDGPLSWSVPGCVSGWETLSERFGTQGFDQTLAPAIEYAENGFAVSEIIARAWRSSERSLNRWPDSANTYLPEGRAPVEGELFRNPNLAASYRLIAKDGAEKKHAIPGGEPTA